MNDSNPLLAGYEHYRDMAAKWKAEAMADLEVIDALRAEVESLRALIVRKDEALRDYVAALEAELICTNHTSEDVMRLDNAQAVLALTPCDMEGWVAVPREPTEAMIEAGAAEPASEVEAKNVAAAS